jgi:hypothetical protein
VHSARVRSKTRVYASFVLSIGASMALILAPMGDHEETLKKHYAKYIESIDP